MESEQGDRDPTRVINLEDTHVVAFLMLKGWKIIPWIEDDPPGIVTPAEKKRVVFDAEGDLKSIREDVQKFNDNEQVGVKDFVRCLKEVKTEMYNLRRLKGR